MRSTLKDAARRVFGNSARAVITKINDDKKMQEVDLAIMFGEEKVSVERFQNYGYTSVPLPEADKKASEAIVLFLGGNRSHGVVIAIDDRRYRLKGLKGGEVAIYDDQGQKVHITRDGILVETTKNVDVKCDGDAFVKAVGKAKVQGGSTSCTMKDGKVYLGKEGVTHKVVTVDGPSDIVFASLGETEG